jgi:hypothetical protein
MGLLLRAFWMEHCSPLAATNQHGFIIYISRNAVHTSIHPSIHLTIHLALSCLNRRKADPRGDLARARVTTILQTPLRSITNRTTSDSLVDLPICGTIHGPSELMVDLSPTLIG